MKAFQAHVTQHRVMTAEAKAAVHMTCEIVHRLANRILCHRSLNFQGNPN